MIAGVADTHTALWHLFDDKRLSTAAGAFINEAATETQDCHFDHKPSRGRLFDREEPSAAVGL
jgi:hypothetical protein